MYPDSDSALLCASINQGKHLTSSPSRASLGFQIPTKERFFAHRVRSCSWRIPSAPMSGQNSPMVVDCNCATKIKAEETELAAGEQCACATKLKLPEPAKQPAAGGDGVEAPTRKMTRLSQEDIDWILSQTKQPNHKYYELGTSPEEVAEEREFYCSLCESHDSHWEDFSRFQDWVRSEYSTKGFVEVDDDFLAHRRRMG